MTSDSIKAVENQFSGFDTSLSLKSVVLIGNDNKEIPSDIETEYIQVVPNTEEQCLYGIRF